VSEPDPIAELQIQFRVLYAMIDSLGRGLGMALDQLGIDHAEACALPELEGEEDKTAAEVVREAERILGLGGS
jgi:hypothetical protein